MRRHDNAKTHVENVRAGGIGIAAAGPKAVEQLHIGIHRKICADIEPAKLNAGRHAPAAQTVVGHCGGDAGDAGTVIPQNFVIEWIGRQRAGAGFEDEVE